MASLAHPFTGAPLTALPRSANPLAIGGPQLPLSATLSPPPTTKHGQYVLGLPKVLGKGVLRDPAHTPLMRCATQTVGTLGHPIPNPDTVAEIHGCPYQSWPQ